MKYLKLMFLCLCYHLVVEVCTVRLMILGRTCVFVQYRIQGRKFTKVSHRSYPSTSACSCCALSYSIPPSHLAVLFTVIAFTSVEHS